ncbi:hypothetical protein AB6F62_10030 [Providencia huaxiensis]|uniref:hypothetical protein n=1 Tax=Providencia huaxiensis TaxID=2027290 RepID=UPI0034DD3018
MSVLTINEEGVPDRVVQVIEGLRNPHSSHVDAINQTALGSLFSEDHIRLFDLHENGYLTEATADQITTAAKSGPVIWYFSPSY